MRLDLGSRHWPVLLGVAWCFLAVMGVAAAPEQVPTADAERAAEAVAGGYDVWVTLADVGPHQKILLDWSDGAGLVLTLDSPATTLLGSDENGQRTLGRGLAARAGEVHIKRREPLVEVSQNGTVLLRTWSQRPLAGQVAPATEARLEGFYVQPTEEIYFDSDFADPEGAGNVWEPLSGSWKVGIYRDALIQRDHGDRGPIGASWYQTQDAQRAVAVAGYGFWDRYRARVSVQATPGTRLGLVCYAQDGANYALLAVRPAEVAGEGLAELSLVRESAETVLAQEKVAWRADTWYELAVEAHDQHVSGRVADADLFDLELPNFTGGRVGVFADGPGLAKFDDVVVRSLSVDRDDFDQESASRECWRISGGDWQLKNGRLQAHGKPLARGLRVGAGGTGTYVAAEVTPRSGAGGICLHWTAASGYVLTVQDGQYTLARFVEGEKTILTRGPVTETEGIPLYLSCSDGRLCARAGSVEEVLYDFAVPSGGCGLCVAGQAEFDHFRTGELPPTGALIAAVSGRPEFVPEEREGVKRPVLGYVWQPRNGRWSPSGGGTDAAAGEPGLALHPGSDQGELWYFQPCPGDAAITAERCTLPSGAALGLAIASEEGDLASGYTLEASASSPPKLVLRRRGEVVAEKEIAASPEVDLALWRDGNYVVGTAGGAGLAYQDDQPLTGGRCGAYARGASVIGKLRLGNRGARYYSFQKVEPDWQPEEGEWRTHSGMACIEWDYWLTGKGTSQAMSYNLHPQLANLHVDFWVSEYTEGYADGRHQHFPYHDLSLVTCAPARSPDSGYRFLIGGEGGRVTRLLRRGEVVAETRDSRFAIAMGGHCNSPRTIHVVVSQRNGQISLRLNDLEALQFTDLEPLGGGYVGLGAADCSANFRDFWMAPVAGGS